MSVAQNLLKIRLDNEIFGIDSDNVDQILRVQPITKVPLTTECMRGISVIAGKIVAVIDFKKLLNSGTIDETNDKTRLLTIKKGTELVGFLVDEVLETISVDDSKFEVNMKSDEVIKGFYKDSKQIVQIVNPSELIKDDMIDSFEAYDSGNFSKDGSDSDGSISQGSSSEAKRCLFFYVRNEKFAIELELLRELIFVPENITSLADSSFANIGVITLRDELINALDFNALLGFGKSDNTDKSRFLILQDNDRVVALSVEAVEEVKDLDSNQIEMMSESFKDSKIESLYKEKDGSIVSIISNSHLKEIIRQNSVSDTKAKQEEVKKEESSDMSEIAVFAIDCEEFAFDIEDVQEIIRYQETTPVPEAPEFVEGIINLRGSVVPVISLPERLGFNRTITDKSKIVVCLIDGDKIGFMVDDVNEILFVEDRFVAKSKNSESLIRETISLNNGSRVILKLNIQKIFTRENFDKIKMLEG